MKITRSMSNKLKNIAIIPLIMAICPHACIAETAFSPLASIKSDTIYLDTQFINNSFPSPSEYKTPFSNPGDIYTPVVTPKQILQRKSEDTNSVSTKEQKNAAEFSFIDMNTLPSPSEYNKKTDKKYLIEDAFAPPGEMIDEPSSYHVFIQEDEDIQNNSPNIEGLPIEDIKITGLRLLDDQIVRKNITTSTVFNSERLQYDLQQIYSTGYFTNTMHIEPTLNDNGTVSLEFVIQENPEIKKVQFIGNKAIDTNELMEFVKNLEGLPQNLNLINASIEKIDKYYNDRGYILAKVSSVDDTPEGILKLEISEGIIKEIVFEGERKTKDYVIQRNIMTEPGSVYNEELIKKDISRIYATQIFEQIDRKIEPSQENNKEYIVKFIVKEASSNSISVGGGLDNALGVFGSIGIQENNFLGKGQQIGLTGMLGSGLLLSDESIKNRMNYQIEFNFREPHFINADNSLISKVYLRELGSYQVPLAVERRFGINGIVEHKVKNKDNISTTLGLGYENIHLKEGDENRISKLYSLNKIPISKRAKQLTGGNFINIAPGIKYNHVDSEFMPREGLIASANYIEALGISDMKTTNGRLVGRLTKYIPMFKKSTLALTARGGIKVHGDNMPEVMAFNLGGPYSVRGFRMNGVGTGDSFLMGSAELQTPIPFMDKLKFDVFKNLRFAFFVDAGKVFDPTISSTLYDRPNSAITAGIGLRVNIPGFGPISIDYGLPLTHVGRYNSKNGYFTFGTGGLYDSY